MATVFGIADVHLANHARHGGPVIAGLNTRARYILAAMRDAVNLADHMNGTLVVAGDLFDVESPSPQLIRAAQDVLSPVPTIVLKGNHDSHSGDAGDHALGPLAPVCTVVDEPTIITLEEGTPVNLWCVPFKAGHAKDWLPGVLRDLAALPKPGVSNLLVVHLGIKDKRTPPFLRNSADAIDAKAMRKLCAAHKIDYVFAGNWHDRRYWESGIQQIGALVPTGWDNEGLDGYGGVATFDPSLIGQRQRVYTVRGPRFVKVRGGIEACDAIIGTARWPDLLHVQAITDPHELSSVADYLARLVGEEGLIAAGEARAETAYREAAAATAAHGARNADTTDAALEAFITRMPMPANHDEPDDRARVLQRARDILVEAMSS